jgi:xylulose-5-phosphate/fructose-6-phosphate phosphoketolase
VSSTDVTRARSASPRELEVIDAYWRAANYLSVGQIYLLGGRSVDTAMGFTPRSPISLGLTGVTVRPA